MCVVPMSVVWSSSDMFTIGRIAYRQEGVFLPLKMHYRPGKGMGVHSAGEVCYLRLPCSKCRPSAIFDLLCACLDHPRRVFGGLSHCPTFRWDRCSSFDSMQVLIFYELDFKMPIHAPKLGMFGYLTYRNPKRHLVVRKHVII